MTAPLSQPPAENATAVCPVHGQPATGTCPRCGTFMCQGCAPGLCPACVTRAGVNAPFFSVSITKLIVMSVVTLGLYELYWFYQQWKHERQRTNQNLSPFWRAFFSGIFSFSLFQRVSNLAIANEVSVSFNPNVLGALVLAFNISWRLPGVLWLISWLGFLPLLPVQSVLNELNEKVAPTADKNARFTAANIVTIVIGGIFVVFSLIGSFMPEQGQ